MREQRDCRARTLVFWLGAYSSRAMRQKLCTSSTCSLSGRKTPPCSTLEAVSLRSEDSRKKLSSAFRKRPAPSVSASIRAVAALALANIIDHLADTEDPSTASLQGILGDGVSDSTASYYRHAVSVFESANGGSSEGLELPVARFCRLAIDAEAARSGESQDRPAWVKELWNKEFRSYCNIGHFDAAYASMMGMPFPNL